MGMLKVALILFAIVWIIVKLASRDNKSKLPNGYYSIISLMAIMSKVDGKVTKKEIDQVDKIFEINLKLDKKQRQIAISIFNSQKDNISLFGNYCKELKNLFTGENDLILIVNLLFMIAFADGKFSKEEEKLILNSISIFNVKGTLYHDYKIQNEKESGTKSNQNNKSNYLNKYYEILNVDKNASYETIKINYRELIIIYHPDKVNHLGPEIIKVAEEKSKEINAAYEYFKTKYNS